MEIPCNRFNKKSPRWKKGFSLKIIHGNPKGLKPENNRYPSSPKTLLSEAKFSDNQKYEYECSTWTCFVPSGKHSLQQSLSFLFWSLTHGFWLCVNLITKWTATFLTPQFIINGHLSLDPGSWWSGPAVSKKLKGNGKLWRTQRQFHSENNFLAKVSFTSCVLGFCISGADLIPHTRVLCWRTHDCAKSIYGLSTYSSCWEGSHFVVQTKHLSQDSPHPPPPTEVIGLPHQSAPRL